MNYKTVFDIDLQPSPWWLWLILTGFTVVGLLMIVAPRLFQRNRAKASVETRIGGVVILVVLLANIWPSVMTLFADYDRYRSLRSTGQCNVVVGNVENFVPMPYEGHTSESFAVQGVKFEYSDYNIRPGFNNARSHGGPITSGLPVRICYVSGQNNPEANVILHLEVGQ